MRSIASLSVAIACYSHAAGAEPSRQIALREDIRAGSGLFQVVRSLESLPQSKRYFQLLPVQRDVLRTLYSNMEVSDDPPYPASGLASLFSLLQFHAKRLDIQGELALEVSVDSNGKAVGTRVIRAPREDMSRFAVEVVMRTRFNPGLCGAIPCAMPFPVALVLRGE